MLEIKDLPVYQHKNQILDALDKNQVIIIESPTGSGKTTQLPLILQEAGYDQKGVIGITQPRRIATLSICGFIKRQLELEEDNHYCAYTMRFDDTTDSTTRIKIMTDGILLQELKANPMLENYSVIMVDEAHERSLNIDFILGLLKQITAVRPELKVIISSATINTEAFSTFFNNAPIISIKAGAFPVEVNYMPLPEEDRFSRFRDDSLYLTISHIVEDSLEKGQGDILIFLPGEFDILQVCEALKYFRNKVVVYPLYGRLSKEEQERVFTPTPEGKTKIVVATNIAETSITIDGIKVVIDSGIAKINNYNQKNFTSSLDSTPISKSSAIQRAGRAGRTAPGVCYRLYTEKEFDKKPEYSVPEILRSDLAEVALRMSELGIYDYEAFPFITAPKIAAIKSAEETLHLIGAIDDNRHLSSIGEMMVLFPLLPRHSRVIVEAIRNYPEILKEAITAISFLSTKSPFLRPQNQEMLARQRQTKFQDSKYGDFVGYLKLFKMYTELENTKAQEKFCKTNFLDFQTMNEIVHIEKQLEEIVSAQNIPITSGGSVDSYLTCLAAGLIQFVCYRYNNREYKSITARNIYIHPGSSWFTNPPKFILAGEIVATSRMFARSVSPLLKSYLDTIDPNLYFNLTGAKEKSGDKKDKNKKATTLNIYGKEYSYYFLPNGKIDHKYITVPYEDLPYIISEGYKAGKAKSIRVKLYAKQTNHQLFLNAEKLKDLIQEGSVIKMKKPCPISNVPSFISLKETKEFIRFLNADLFRIVIAKNRKMLQYVGIDHFANNGIQTKGFYSLTEVIDQTYYVLKNISSKTKNKDIKTAIDAVLSQIDMLEDF